MNRIRKPEVNIVKSPRSVSDAKLLATRHRGSWPWIGLLLAVWVVFSLSIAACGTSPAVDAEAAVVFPDDISVGEAYQKYQEGVFLLDVRTQEEWDEYHAPDTTLIPLDQLEGRLDELPPDEEIVVVCRSGNRSQAGRDILRNNGFERSTSMSGGLNAWRAAGYPIE
jgi:rhodanese-related sulfurtransferase